MPVIYLSPSTQEYNLYLTDGTEEEYMNLIADRMEPYLRASGIYYTRNNREGTAADAIRESNSGSYDAHLAVHSNAAPENLKGQLRGIEAYYYPGSESSLRLATLIINNFKEIYPIPERCRTIPTDYLGEVTRTRAPAVLVEIGYHDNAADERWIKNNLTLIAKTLVISLCDFFGIPFVEPSARQYGYVSTERGGLNLRQYPSTEAPILAQIPRGAQITVYGRNNGWLATEFNGQNGFVSAEFVVL